MRPSVNWNGRSCIKTTIAHLKQSGLLYPCFESEQELKAKQEFRRKRNQPRIYDRAMLSLTSQPTRGGGGRRQAAALAFAAVRPNLVWQDLIQGERRAELCRVSDPILVRADGTAAPILASVVDDIAFETTHIIRDEDNGGNTAIQIELFEALKPARQRFGSPICRRSTRPHRRRGTRI